MRRLLVSLTLTFAFVLPAQADVYRVRPGDSLYKIARKFHTTVAKIKRLNGLRSNRIRVGQKLIIPGTRHTPSWYRKFKPRKSSETIAFLERKSEQVLSSQIVESEINPLTEVVYREAEELAQVLSTPLNVKYDNWSLSILNDPEYKGALFKLLAEIFKSLKNTPYVFGGNNPRFGLDCSSFTMYVYRKLGINLPRTARAQFNVGVPVDVKNLKVGDLVFFRTYARYPSHVGIYIGNGKFIHFSSMYHGLAISSLSDRYFKRRFIGAKRVLSEKKVKKIIYALTKNN
ncbi:MAG: NlpC/P60 family protein [Desulfurobacteriaceae bacterium]